MSHSPPVALTLAGSDNCAGAGLQADLKTFQAHGIHGLTAVTAIVAEIPGKVEALHPLPQDIVEAQLRLLFDTYPVAAWKTGMLHSAVIVRLAVAQQAALAKSRAVPPPLVVDPVLIASSGDALVEDETISAYTQDLFPLATLVTPNLGEAARLSGRSITDLDSLRDAGRLLADTYGVPFLMKGGHLAGPDAIDLLIRPGTVHETVFSAPFVKGVDPHGTGCTYSAAITAGLARGLLLIEAIEAAKRFITKAIEQRLAWQTPSGKQVEALNQSLPGWGENISESLFRRQKTQSKQWEASV